jgi:HD-GYP domain-containing protein (c-di-GMP phosphodiesterase class II)
MMEKRQFVQFNPGDVSRSYSMRVARDFEHFRPEDSLARIESTGLSNSGSLVFDPEDSKPQEENDNISGIRLPIRMKITIPYLFLALVIAMVGAYIVTQIVFDTIEERFTNQLLETGKIAAEWIVKEEDKLLETLRLVAHTSGTAEAVEHNNAELLREIAFPILLNASVEALEILDENGVSILSLRHRTGGFLEEYDVSRGDSSFRNWEIVNQVINQQVDPIGDKYAGIALAEWGDYLYVSGPIFDQNHELAGAILIGDSLDKIAHGIRESTLSQVTIYDLEGQEITSTLIEPATPLEQMTVREVIVRQDDESYFQEFTAANIAYQEVVAPFEVRSGADVGILGTSLAKTFLVQTSNITRFQIFTFATVTFLIIIAAGLFIADRFTKPLLKVVDASSQVAAGNLDISVAPSGNDEITELSKSFNEMVSSLQRSEADLIRAHEETIQAYDRTIEGWCKALELRDNVTEGHTQRVTELTILIAREMGIAEEEYVHIRRGALMHDIGKMAIPDSILKKPSALSDDEWLEMRKHPSYAFDMLSQISYLMPALAIPYCHHEKWDGSGYPRGISGEEIPIEARIFAIADVWDALRSDRPYRKAVPVETVLKYIEENKEQHFDPDVVDAFLIVYDEYLANRSGNESLPSGLDD